MKAIWNGQVIAESNDTVVIEGNHYFPKDSIKNEYYQDSEHKTHCFWKGEASYLTLEVNGEKNEDAAWFYPTPSDAAKNIKDYVAFWKGVEVTE